MEIRSLALLAGGRTVEHDLSLESANALAASLEGSSFETTIIRIDAEGRWSVADPLNALSRFDYVLPLVHGDRGAGLHGLLSMLEVPVLGEEVAAAAIALDKPLSKRLLRESGLPVARDVVVSRRELASSPREVFARVAHEVGFPCFVKPATGCASAGCVPVWEPSQLVRALMAAAAFDSRILVEPWLDAREIEVGVVCGEASLPGELVFRSEIHDYATKLDASKLELVIPAMVNEQDRERLQAISVSAACALGLSSVGRVELFIDRNTKQIFVNEVNAVPAFGSGSPFPRLWEASGVPVEELVDRLAKAADARMRDLFRTRRSAAPEAASA